MMARNNLTMHDDKYRMNDVTMIYKYGLYILIKEYRIYSYEFINKFTPENR